ncbi:TSUP family transporter [Candidatus Marinimicrobia bacterium]|nr:TSUP family transporter [Candidatus Neomarinimicrobiota bacterium]
MFIDILLTIILTSVIQSMFGTGVLLFGTPLLLLYGYDFQFVLTVLLPTSVMINFFQLMNKYNDIDIQFYKKLVLWCVPLIVLFLYFTSLNPIKINIIVGAFIIIIALKEVSSLISKGINIIIKHEVFYLILTGVVHGITNLGGALLSSIVFSKNLSKEKTRATIAICYLTFAVFQIITLRFSMNNYEIFNIVNSIYWFSGLGVFFIVENFLYLKIDNKWYKKYFTVFLLLIGSLLILKN